MNSETYEAVLEDLKRRRIPPEVKGAVRIMLDKKAENIVVLKLKGLSDITDFLVLCQGNSSRQNSAISGEIRKQLSKNFKTKPFGVEGEREGEWVLMDYIDFVVHVFSPEIRERYGLEKMWMDAKRYDFSPA